ncbi:DNA-directed RNA polymerase III RPC5 [Babesia ovata]|uniref:DNA-directed RNA polymerase III RPC5 n=1 Tax=Babesia ovata TaxID=189622 RepID=A0A2H6KI20_9APIC|nr:DNA-directed RNA polymerase III RPC5 [Babesia ovata]GBE62642.1 DNA-directed RNA polymerase III RPC5 [Babesia ovata]
MRDAREDEAMDLDPEEDDPIVCEFDVFVNNTVLQDLLGRIAEPANTISVASELCSKPFGDLFLLQYPLELSTSDCPDASKEVDIQNRIALSSNATDMLPLSTLSIGKESKREVVDERTYGVASIIKKSKRSSCPYLKFVYDLGTKYPVNVTSLSAKKSSRVSSPFLRYEPSDLTNTIHLFDLAKPVAADKKKTLKLRSEIVTGDHVCDCLGVLVVEETDSGLVRSLHIVPVRGVIQLRPKVKPYMSEIVNFDDTLNSLFQNRNLQWRDVGKISEMDSEESREIVQMLTQRCRTLQQLARRPMYFHEDPSMYINAVCFAQEYGKYQDEWHRSLESDVDGYQHSTNPAFSTDTSQVAYRSMHENTPNVRFMGTLEVRTQLKLLLTQRYIDSFYALKKDIIVGPDVNDDQLIVMLQEFATNIDGNWILSSEHAIPNYTTEDDFDDEDRAYLIVCRDVILGLFYRDVVMRDLLQKGAYGHVTIEAVHSLTGLPVRMVHEMISQVAMQHGKLWTLKLKRDSEFYNKYGALMKTYQVNWSNRLLESMKHVKTLRETQSSKVSQIIYRYILKGAITSALKNRVYSAEQISQELTAQGYSIDSAPVFESLLKQVAMPFLRGDRKMWVLKKSHVSLNSLKMVLSGQNHPGTRRLTVDEVRRTLQDSALPGFLKRRISMMPSS